MGTFLDLINQAVAGDLGEEVEITDADLTADPAPRALRVARRFTTTLRDEFLRRHAWLCAETDVTLNPSTEPASSSWRYARAYLLPTNCLKIWNVADIVEPWQRGSVVEFNEDGTEKGRRDAILTDYEGALKVTYAARIDYELMDPCLFRAMACELAARMAGPMQADKVLRRDLAGTARELLAIAVTCEVSEFGNEAPPLATSRFLDAR